MNFLLTLFKFSLVSFLSFILYVGFIGPFFANTFDWHGDDPTALLGPEWIWNYAFLWSIVCFFFSSIYFGRIDDTRQTQQKESDNGS